MLGNFWIDIQIAKHVKVSDHQVKYHDILKMKVAN